jgi:hypothetical protein
MEYSKLILRVNLQLVTVQQPDTFLTPCDMIENSDYHKTSLLPNKSLDLWKAPSKAVTKIIEERVSLLLCSNGS